MIINVSSDAGVEAYPRWAVTVEQSGARQLSRTLGAELEGTGVRVYCVDRET